MTRLLVLFVLLLGTAARAQCNGPTSVSLTPYGGTCTYWSANAALQARYDTTTCVLQVQFDAARTCCNVYLRQRLLLLGVQPIVPGLPLPALVPGCELAVVPLVALIDAGGRAPFALRLPPITGVTLYVQGVNTYFTTIGLHTDLQTTDGLRVSF